MCKKFSISICSIGSVVESGGNRRVWSRCLVPCVVPVRVLPHAVIVRCRSPLVAVELCSEPSPLSWNRLIGLLSGDQSAGNHLCSLRREGPSTQRDQPVNVRIDREKVAHRPTHPDHTHVHLPASLPACLPICSHIGNNDVLQELLCGALRLPPGDAGVVLLLGTD